MENYSTSLKYALEQTIIEFLDYLNKAKNYNRLYNDLKNAFFQRLRNNLKCSEFADSVHYLEGKHLNLKITNNKIAELNFVNCPYFCVSNLIYLIDSLNIEVDKIKVEKKLLENDINFCLLDNFDNVINSINNYNINGR